MNQLTRIDEFREVLADYHSSSEALESIKDLRFVLFVGPTSSGRNTIISELLKSGLYTFVISDTTRQPRVNNGILEENGREYWFRSEVDMLADLREGKFLEAAIIHNQQVSGMSIRELKLAASKGLIAVNEIEITGAGHVHSLVPHAKFLFVLPPSFDEWIARMNGRGTLPADETKRRLASAVDEIKYALEQDFFIFVVNNTFMQTATTVDDIIRHHKVPEKDQLEGRKLAKQLLADTKEFLADLKRDSKYPTP